MHKDEREQLMDGENRSERSFMVKWKCCFLVYYCTVAVLLIFGMMYYFYFIRGKGDGHNYFGKKEKLGSSKGKFDVTKYGFSQNSSEFFVQNLELCGSVSSNDTAESANTMNHIYIIKGEKNLTDEQACATESVLRLFPEKTIFIVDFNKKEKTNYQRGASPPNYLGLLLYLYKDRVELLLADRDEFFKGTPLQNLTKRESGSLEKEFLPLLLTAYKYGGLVLSPDAVMSNREFVESSVGDTVVEPFLITAPKKCSDFLHYLMWSINICGEDAPLDSMLTQSIELYSKSLNSRKLFPRRLEADEVCTNSKESCSFLRLKEFKSEEAKWVCELSSFCKQVVKEFLGVKFNKMEVEEETLLMKSRIGDSDGKICENCNRVYE